MEHVFEQNDFPAPRAHRAVLHGDHAVGDVHHVLRPGLPHELQHLEELPEMEILLVGDDVQALVKVVCFFAVDRRGEVARGVEGRAVRL